MGTTIRVSDDTKEKLEYLKREGETFDELLNRLAKNRTEEDVRRLAGSMGDVADFEEKMAESRKEVRDDFEKMDS